MVLTAKDPSSPGRREALDRLIQTYWKPAYFFISGSARELRVKNVRVRNGE